MVDPYKYPEPVVADSVTISEAPLTPGYTRCEFRFHGGKIAVVLLPTLVAQNAFRPSVMGSGDLSAGT